MALSTKIRVAAVVLALATVVIAELATVAIAEDAADVNGWGKAKWGMTEAQVRELYPEATMKPIGKNGAELLTLPGVEIQGAPFQSVFAFKDGKLNTVEVDYVGPKDDAYGIYQKIRTSLYQKYGKPNGKSEHRDMTDKARWHRDVWLLRSGSLQATHAAMPDKDSSLNLIYLAAQTDNL